jgi:impB/mucB/samB family C-terminal domain
LPEDSLVARFGTRGGQLSRLARGRQEAVMRPYDPPPALEEKSDLDWQIIELEPLAFLLSGLLERLCVKLQGHNLAAAEIRVALKLADGSRYERAVAMSHPLADPRTLLTLARIDLAAHPPGDAIEGVTVAAQPVPRRLTQFSLFDPALPSPEKLAVTLARLTQLVGPGRVGSPVLPDAHRPGAFAVETFRVATDPRAATDTRAVATGAPACPTPWNGDAAQPEGFANPGVQRLSHCLMARPTSTTRSIGKSTGISSDRVVVFPKLDQHPLQIESADKKVAPSDSAISETKVVVFASPFHGGQAGAPVATTGAARRSYPGIEGSEAACDGLMVSAASTCPQTNQTAADSRRGHAFRCFRPSAEAEVLLRDRLPVYVESFEVRGTVRTIAGPWQICGEWWAEGWQYEEWDVEVNGRLYRICCEAPSRKWYVTGTYD